jgi:hypothetical protein
MYMKLSVVSAQFSAGVTRRTAIHRTRNGIWDHLLAERPGDLMRADPGGKLWSASAWCRVPDFQYDFGCCDV